MFEVVQTPLHILAISSLWDEVLQLFHSILELGRKTQRLWFIAAVEVGGKDCGSNWDVFEVTFS